MITPPTVQSPYPDNRPAIPSFVSALTWHIPQMECYATGQAFADLVITKGPNVSETDADTIRLNYAKYLYIERSFAQANVLQEQATSYHTISKSTAQVQADIYKVKFDAAYSYVMRYEQAQSVSIDPNSVPVPPILLNESQLVGDQPYEMSLSIIANYNASHESLKNYFGMIEGQRRLLKRRILEASSVNELLTLSWAEWPVYEPTTPVDLEG